jgi:transforming growth factor-beta-induced protein
MKVKSIMTFAIAGLLTTALVPAAQADCGGCGTHTHGSKAEKTAASEMTIVETAVSAGSFTTLVAAVKAAGLAETLSGSGPFTVFAPTDDAFAKLPQGTVENLLKNPEKLAAILTYHVVPGNVKATDVANMKSAGTVQGASITITSDKKGVKVDNANVVQTDIICSNGVIHVIDAVILPKNIVETASSAGSFNTLLAAAKAAGLVETLSGDGPFTVFAPTDDAFAKLPAGTVESLLKDKEKLAAILTYHVVSGKVMAGDVAGMKSAKTVQGQSLRIDASAGVMVNQARVIAADVVTSNGVIHVIDEVLLPN